MLLIILSHNVEAIAWHQHLYRLLRLLVSSEQVFKAKMEDINVWNGIPCFFIHVREKKHSSRDKSAMLTSLTEVFQAFADIGTMVWANGITSGAHQRHPGQGADDVLMTGRFEGRALRSGLGTNRGIDKPECHITRTNWLWLDLDLIKASS